MKNFRRYRRVGLAIVLSMVLAVGYLSLAGCRDDSGGVEVTSQRVRTKRHTFQDGVAATGNGTVLHTSGYPYLSIDVEGIVTATVSFEQTVNGTDWRAFEAVNTSDGSKSTTATADGTWVVGHVGVYDYVRCRVSSWTSGTITVMGQAMESVGESLEDVEVTTSSGLEVVQDTAADLAVTEASASAIKTAVETIDNAISGAEMQVDVATITAGETHLGEIGAKSDVISVTLTLAATTYASGDVLADTQAITDAMRVNAGTGVLYAVTVIDLDDQGQALDILVFDTDCSIGTEDSAVSIADSCADDLLGAFEVASGDYIDLVNSQVAMASPAFLVESTAGIDELWFAVVSRGTGTYTASGVIVKFHWMLD